MPRNISALGASMTDVGKWACGKHCENSELVKVSLSVNYQWIYLRITSNRNSFSPAGNCSPEHNYRTVWRSLWIFTQWRRQHHTFFIYCHIGYYNCNYISTKKSKSDRQRETNTQLTFKKIFNFKKIIWKIVVI